MAEALACYERHLAADQIMRTAILSVETKEMEKFQASHQQQQPSLYQHRFSTVNPNSPIMKPNLPTAQPSFSTVKPNFPTAESIDNLARLPGYHEARTSYRQQEQFCGALGRLQDMTSMLSPKIKDELRNIRNSNDSSDIEAEINSMGDDSSDFHSTSELLHSSEVQMM